MSIGPQNLEANAASALPVLAKLPDFIGIGPPRTATTWLHEMLTGSVGLPDQVKETNFFRWNYDKGLDWYVSLFRNAPSDRPIGEFSPNYFAASEARERIARHIPKCKIICTLRDPVERLYSNYRKMYEQAYFLGSFEESLERRPDLLEWSRYALHLMRWIDAFGRESVLVLIHDDLKEDPQTFLDRACDFIGIPSISLSEKSRVSDRVNAITNAPKYPRVAMAARLVKDRLEAAGLYRVIRLLDRGGLRKALFAGGPTFAPLRKDTEAWLRDYFRADVESLEKILDCNLQNWKKELPA